MHWEKKLILITNDSAEFLHLQNYPKLSVFQNNKNLSIFRFPRRVAIYKQYRVRWINSTCACQYPFSQLRNNNSRDPNRCPLDTPPPPRGLLFVFFIISLLSALIHGHLARIEVRERGTNKSKISARDIIYRLSNYETISPRGSRDFR